MKCLEFEQIMDRIEVRLTQTASAKIDKHLGSCSKCRESRDWVEKTIGLMRSDDLKNAPEPVVARALKIFGKPDSVSTSWIPAVLEFDSWSLPAMQGMRSTERGPRQWIFTTRHYRVIVHLETLKKKRTLIGQLVAAASAGVQNCLVEVLSRARAVSKYVTNDRGEFLFHSVPATDIELRIHTDSESILIPLAL